MRQSFANFIAAPFIGGALFFLYLTWTKDSYLAPWIIPFVVMATLIYVFSPQINWWWYSRRPPVLPTGLQDLLERNNAFYQGLKKTDKQRFRNRTALFMMATDWTPMAWPDETVPLDVQMALAAQAVTLTFNRTDYLFEKFEKVIVYPYPFPTPEYDFVHASELYEADSCLLFSAQQLMLACIEPTKYYNIGMHEYAKAFVLLNPQIDWPSLTDDAIWEKLQISSQMSRQHVESVVGLSDLPAMPVAIHHYFIFPEQFRVVLPELAARFDQIFK